MIEVLNLGAGVQSSTVFLMSIQGELPSLDYCVFADTGWEPPDVYQQVDWLQSVAEKEGVSFHRVQAGGIKKDALESQVRGTKKKGKRWASMPYFTLSPEGEVGQIRRQCTSEYKIKPIETFVRSEILKLRPRQRGPKEQVVRHWFGISLDEFQRMRTSDQKWCENWYPLIERRMTRNSCREWLRRNGYPEAPRSACIGCPFHNNREWRDMKSNRPEDWKEAVEFDAKIRKCGGMRGDVFLHRDCAPLDEVNLWKDVDKNQLSLFDGECEGMCGV